MENLRSVGKLLSNQLDKGLAIYVPEDLEDEELLDVVQACKANFNDLFNDLGFYRRFAVLGTTLSLTGGLLSEGNPSFIIPAAGTLLAGFMAEMTVGLSELRYRNVSKRAEEVFLND